MKRFHQSPTDPAFVQDPYPFYDRIRSAGDLIWWDDYGMACATTHKSATAALREKRMGREVPPEMAPDTPAHLEPFYAREAHSMLELEPPTHTRLRGLVLRAFTSRRIAALTPDITALSNMLIDAFPTEPFDLLDAFARPLPVRIIARLLGVPEDNSAQLLSWSNDMVAMYQARRTRAIEDAAATATREFSAYIAEFITEKRAAPTDDLISTLIAAEEEGAKLSRDELISTCILLLNAGHEATVHTIGNGVKTLLESGVHDVTPQSVEEIFRFDPPLHMFTRWVYEDMTFFGAKLKRGDQIGCLLASANRDPLAYENPEIFMPERTGPANTSFGGGIHFCVGAPLARLEVLHALQILFERCPRIRLVEQPAYADVYHFHGLTRLMVAID
ncbi:Cytochrome P450 [Cognatiyoonia koreensis]|uniref:Cytochrome P450 n=1 Tax=Cognatiyoonia koreensis TaxID=364200 RepID=A0A1I0PQZ8_9RHOB|nr:cytochrome P450 [Cognatiyoonia koreensis]SEW16790.1 Cytochrome P450 [Cognatiyoonia koreensis]